MIESIWLTYWIAGIYLYSAKENYLLSSGGFEVQKKKIAVADTFSCVHKENWQEIGFFQVLLVI